MRVPTRGWSRIGRRIMDELHRSVAVCMRRRDRLAPRRRNLAPSERRRSGSAAQPPRAGAPRSGSACRSPMRSWLSASSCQCFRLCNFLDVSDLYLRLPNLTSTTSPWWHSRPHTQPSSLPRRAPTPSRRCTTGPIYAEDHVCVAGGTTCSRCTGSRPLCPST